MMDVEAITRNEGANDGTRIFLYLSPVSGQWVAYGLSAYALRLWVNAQKKDSLRSYSSEMKLACVAVSRFTLDDMRKSVKIVNEQEGEMLVFEVERSFIYEDYLQWVDKLAKEDEKGERIIDIHTTVSDKVPKGVFIKDNMTSFERNVKRLSDMFVAFVTMVVFSPLFVLCWILIKLDDGGPAIYAQERIGRFGRPFKIYKFRSMRTDSEKAGPQLSSQGGANDSRLTKVGAFLRAHHLDELPQLWNVFCGDMSFVGPRPERQFFIDQILEYDRRYTYLYQIRPGVTSYATLYNGYTDTMEKMLRRLEYDLYYLGHRSWLFDMKTLWLTFWGIVSGKKL